MAASVLSTPSTKMIHTVASLSRKKTIYSQLRLPATISRYHDRASLRTKTYHLIRRSKMFTRTIIRGPSLRMQDRHATLYLKVDIPTKRASFNIRISLTMKIQGESKFKLNQTSIIVTTRMPVSTKNLSLLNCAFSASVASSSARSHPLLSLRNVVSQGKRSLVLSKKFRQYLHSTS